MQTIRESKRGFLKSRISPLVLASSRHTATFKIFIPIISRLAKFSKGHFLFKSRIPSAILKLSRIPPTISKLSRTVHQLKWARPYPEKYFHPIFRLNISRIPHTASIFLVSHMQPPCYAPSRIPPNLCWTRPQRQSTSVQHNKLHYRKPPLNRFLGNNHTLYNWLTLILEPSLKYKMKRFWNLVFQ